MSTGFIDWTDSGLTLFVFDKKGVQYVLSGSESVSFENGPEPSSLAPLARSGMRDVYLSVPLDLLTLREHIFPFEDRDKISDTITFELEGVLLGSTEDYVIDHRIIEKAEGGTRVLAVCLEKKKLKEIIELFASAGLDPKEVTSLDICMSGGRTEDLFEKTPSDPDARAEAAAGELRAHTINLRQQEMAYTGDIERLKKALRSSALLVLILAVIFGANAYLQLHAEKQEHEALREAAHSAYRAIFPDERKIIDIERQLNGKLRELERKESVLTGIPVLGLLRTVAEINSKDIILNAFSADGSSIIIKGTAVTFEDVDRLKDDLAEHFRGTKVVDSGARADKRIGFTILMKERGI